MIERIGVDLVDNRRIEKILTRHGNSFLEKFLTPREIRELQSKKTYLHLAGIFAAKEAAIKSLGGLKGKTTLLDVEVLYDSSGAPFVKLIASLSKKLSIRVSISHEMRYTVACAVSENISVS